MENKKNIKIEAITQFVFMNIKALVALKKGCVFCHCKFLLEMAIDEDRNLDSEAEDAVAKITDCEVNDQDGG